MKTISSKVFCAGIFCLGKCAGNLGNFPFIFICIVLSMPGLSWAQVEDSGQSRISDYCKSMNAVDDCINPSCIKEGKNLCIEQNRFKPYQPNNAVWQSTDRDDHSIEVNYSFRYLLSSPDCTGKYKDHCIDFERRWEHFITYTGKFDFYLGSRTSGPVVNRLSNPAWHSRIYIVNESIPLNWLDIGIEHKSNGQVVSANEQISGSTQYRAEAEYVAGNHQYIDSISRSVNYLSVEAKKEFALASKKGYEIYIKLYALHGGEESDVYWGEYAGQNIKFADFERVRSIFNIPLNDATKDDDKRELGVEWTVGDRGLATDSATVWLRWPFDIQDYHIPFTVRAHVGPMNELSNYSEDQRSLGFGLSFFH